MKAVIFDMDGVLVDSEPQHFKAINRTLNALCGAALSWEDYLSYVGTSDDWMWSRFREIYRLDDPADALKARFETVRDAIDAADGFIPVPGSQALVRALAERGVTLAVASSSAPELIGRTIDGLGLRDCFAHLVSTAQAGRCKPAPDVFLMTARLLGRDPADCFVVEDSAAGVRAAKAAGMACAALRNPNSGAQDISPADLIFERFDGQTVQAILRLL